MFKVNRRVNEIVNKMLSTGEKVNNKVNKMVGTGKNTEKKRRTAAFLAAVFIIASACAGLSGCGKAKESLTIFTWEGMFPQELLDGFTNETGIEINYAVFDTDETMLAKLQASKGGDYDFVIADDYIIEQAIEEGLASELDRSKLTNWDNINPVYQGQYYDPDDKYTVPCGAGIMEFAYRTSALDFEIKAYEDLWNEALEGKLGIIENPRVIVGMALKMDGESFNTTDTDAIKAAGERLNSLAPNIRLIKDQFINDDLVSGEIDAAFLYTSQAVTAALADPGIITVVPEEGAGFGVMGGFIPSDAPNSDAAHKFIDFLNDAENAAVWYSYMGYYCTNKAAEEYLDPEIKDYIILPDSVDIESLEMIENIPGEVYSLEEEIWTAFRAKCNQ